MNTTTQDDPPDHPGGTPAPAPDEPAPGRTASGDPAPGDTAGGDTAGTGPGGRAAPVAAPSADPPAGYRRSAGSPRGEARRRELLELVTADLAAHGMVDFSLRRAARAAGTTHKVLLYHFASADDLLRQAVVRLRERRIDESMSAAGVPRPDVPAPEGAPTAGSAPLEGTLSDRVRAMWPVVVAEQARVLDQAIGLAMYDPARHGELASGATHQYLPALIGLCPPQWTDRRKHEVAHLILGALRGFLIDARTRNALDGAAAGLEALARALDREEAAGE
ncbi:TetR/AcrR family transcriptional regulator [Yinghuangia seranimata]|uniref:TetR/AcrR family transcriptional regulator n=1 Tax=Yinghuangia seranimata TaxID=408067 RepID=UPI00248CA695|nr:TetR/AcrR family transcriptional regulator [Yinghuangia seranimata]MDI2127750.1 TetR/AcrR family transcriptional regulator [Yinghuangia seranimata]